LRAVDDASGDVVAVGALPSDEQLTERGLVEQPDMPHMPRDLSFDCRDCFNATRPTVVEVAVGSARSAAQGVE
jgi:hypothetical protein